VLLVWWCRLLVKFDLIRVNLDGSNVGVVAVRWWSIRAALAVKLHAEHDKRDDEKNQLNGCYSSCNGKDGQISI